VGPPRSRPQLEELRIGRAGDGADRAPTRPGSVRCGLGRELLDLGEDLVGSGNSPLPYRSMNRIVPCLSTMNVARTLAFQSGQ